MAGLVRGQAAVGWQKENQPQLFSDPAKKGEPFSGKTMFSGAAAQKKKDTGCH